MCAVTNLPRLPRTQPPLKYGDVLKVAIDVASAMAYLHPTVVHRDLKPSNVLLDLDGCAKVTNQRGAALTNLTRNRVAFIIVLLTSCFYLFLNYKSI